MPFKERNGYNGFITKGQLESAGNSIKVMGTVKNYYYYYYYYFLIESEHHLAYLCVTSC